jgi:hypothetical protein
MILPKRIHSKNVLKHVSKTRLSIRVDENVDGILKTLRSLNVVPTKKDGVYMFSEHALLAALTGAYAGGVEAKIILDEQDSAERRPLLPQSFIFMAGIIIGLLLGWLLR